jgi:SET domain-containing protein
MILVKTHLAPSSISGIGCFASEDIPQGTPIWRFVRGFDLEVPPEYPNTLPDAAKDQFLNYAYISRTTGNYILCSDDTRFFNHSDEPNVISTSKEGEQEGLDVAAHDIKKGEELLYDYRVFADNDPHVIGLHLNSEPAH